MIWKKNDCFKDISQKYSKYQRISHDLNKTWNLQRSKNKAWFEKLVAKPTMRVRILKQIYIFSLKVTIWYPTFFYISHKIIYENRGALTEIQDFS